MMDLTDAALRERAVRECPEGPPHTRCPRCDWQAAQYIALRDAARAEQREADAYQLADYAHRLRHIFSGLGNYDIARECLSLADALDRAAAFRSQR